MLVQQNFVFASCFLRSKFLHVKKLLRRIHQHGCSFAKRQSIRDISAFGTLVGLLLLNFQCQLATIELLIGGLSRQPDWACFRLCARVDAPGNRSWSVQPRGPSFAASSTLGSLHGYSHCQWAVCSNDTNLALVVPGRLLLTGRIKLATHLKTKFLY
jgi:hypothetical protein